MVYLFITLQQMIKLNEINASFHFDKKWNKKRTAEEKKEDETKKKKIKKKKSTNRQ